MKQESTVGRPSPGAVVAGQRPPCPPPSLCLPSGGRGLGAPRNPPPLLRLSQPLRWISAGSGQRAGGQEEKHRKAQSWRRSLGDPYQAGELGRPHPEQEAHTHQRAWGAREERALEQPQRPEYRVSWGAWWLAFVRACCGSLGGFSRLLAAGCGFSLDCKIDPQRCLRGGNKL